MNLERNEALLATEIENIRSLPAIYSAAPPHVLRNAIRATDAIDTAQQFGDAHRAQAEEAKAFALLGLSILLTSADRRHGG